MSDRIPVLEGESISSDEERLIAYFEEIRAKQLDRIDEAGKRIIELSTGMLGVLFGVTALGKDFPPPYLVNDFAKGLAIFVLLFYIVALLYGFLTVQPRNYPHERQNLTKMAELKEEIHNYKSSRMKRASGLFFIATLLLAVLVAIIILTT